MTPPLPNAQFGQGRDKGPLSAVDSAVINTGDAIPMTSATAASESFKQDSAPEGPSGDTLAPKAFANGVYEVIGHLGFYVLTTLVISLLFAGPGLYLWNAEHGIIGSFLLLISSFLMLILSSSKVWRLMLLGILVLGWVTVIEDHLGKWFGR